MKLNELVRTLVIALDEGSSSNSNKVISDEVIFFSKHPPQLEKSTCEYNFSELIAVNDEVKTEKPEWRIYRLSRANLQYLFNPVNVYNGLVVFYDQVLGLWDMKLCDHIYLKIRDDYEVISAYSDILSENSPLMRIINYYLKSNNFKIVTGSTTTTGDNIRFVPYDQAYIYSLR